MEQRWPYTKSINSEFIDHKRMIEVPPYLPVCCCVQEQANKRVFIIQSFCIYCQKVRNHTSLQMEIRVEPASYNEICDAKLNCQTRVRNNVYVFNTSFTYSFSFPEYEIEQWDSVSMLQKILSYFCFRLLSIIFSQIVIA